MGCLLQSIGVIFLFALLIPVLLLMNLFGRFRRHTHTQQDDDATTNSYTTQEDNDTTERINTPIDQSTVEYIDFEEVDDK